MRYPDGHSVRAKDHAAPLLQNNAPANQRLRPSLLLLKMSALQPSEGTDVEIPGLPLSSHMLPVTVPDTSTPARATAVRIEDAIRRDYLETGVIIAPDGTEVDRKRGTPDRVGFTGARLSLVARATLTHNHPGGTGPSVPDMLIAVQYGFHELRVVTQHYRHIVNSLGGIQVASLDAEYSDQVKLVQHEVRTLLAQGGLRRMYFHAEVVNMAWERTANVLGFYYRRERS